MKTIIKWFTLMAAVVTLSGCGINNIPTLDEGVKATWAQVENQYKRRADLIPNLVETVKGFAKHEKDVLTQVIEARARATQMTLPKDILSNPAAFKQFEASQGQLSSALARLMVVVEKYPELKADKNFQQLQAQLEGTENRIAVARRDYIQAVQKYNTELRTFPGRLWAMTLYRDMKVKESFSAPPEAKEAPTVKF